MTTDSAAQGRTKPKPAAPPKRRPRRVPKPVPPGLIWFSRGQVCDAGGLGMPLYLRLVREGRIRETRFSDGTIRIHVSQLDRLAPEPT